MKMLSLRKILSNHFVKFSLLPIFIIEAALLVLYFSINYYITQQNSSQLRKDVSSYSVDLLKNESNKIDQTLSEVTRLTSILQSDHQRILRQPNFYNIVDIPDFQVANNGVYYKATRTGSSLYYSSQTPITDKEKAKAVTTEAMDPLLMDVVNGNENIVAAYFNSYDDMNRLYPYIDNVYDQYGEHIHMEDYNFYYLADSRHNPSRHPIWTEAYLDPAGNGWMLSCIAPIYTGDFLEGVSGVDITIEKLVSNILDLNLPYNAHMFMVNSDGMIIAMPGRIEKLLGLQELKNHTYTDPITHTVTKPREFNIFKNTSPFALLLQSVLKNKHNNEDLTLDGEEFILMRQVVEETQWQLMIMLDKKNVFATVNQLKSLSNAIGYSAIVFMGIFYLIFFYFLMKKSNQVSSYITEPIEILTKQTSMVGSKNLQTTIIDTRIDEIYKLSSNFSKMVNQLDQRTEKIVEIELQKKATEEEVLLYMDKSLKDPLTGLYNRNKIDQILPVLIKDFEDRKKPIFCIFIDIDHFKSINDTFGHATGDEVLKEFATVLKTTIRQNDILCRMGGEEFVVFCKTGVNSAEKIAEKLRLSIANHTFPIPRQVTSSFGVAQILATDTGDTFMDRADKALYIAKKSGRNRVHVS